MSSKLIVGAVLGDEAGQWAGCRENTLPQHTAACCDRRATPFVTTLSPSLYVSLNHAYLIILHLCVSSTPTCASVSSRTAL